MAAVVGLFFSLFFGKRIDYFKLNVMTILFINLKDYIHV